MIFNWPPKICSVSKWNSRRKFIFICRGHVWRLLTWGYRLGKRILEYRLSRWGTSSFDARFSSLKHRNYRCKHYRVILRGSWKTNIYFWKKKVFNFCLISEWNNSYKSFHLNVRAWLKKFLCCHCSLHFRETSPYYIHQKNRDT